MVNITIEVFTSEKPALLKDSFRIRNKVFVEEQGVDKYLEYDGLDDKAVHYLLKYNEKAAATARWRETDEGIKLERFAVLQKYRGKALASLILKHMLEELIPSKRKIYLNAQSAVEGFYKIHGFKRVGEKFVEAEIDHYKMEYSMQKND